jgi:FixJ family two-component response regulator
MIARSTRARIEPRLTLLAIFHKALDAIPSYKHHMTEQHNTLITIVDGNFLLRRYLVRLLTAAEYTTESFATADEFLAAAVTREPACLVLDIELKDSTGVLLARHPTLLTPRCPIVFTSGTINESVQREAFELGGKALVRRPFKAADILSAIASALPPR